MTDLLLTSFVSNDGQARVLDVNSLAAITAEVVMAARESLVIGQA
jgi:hypothetical protein